MRRMRSLAALSSALLALTALGCGASAKHPVSPGGGGAGTPDAAIQAGLRTAANPGAAQFPSPQGRSVLALANGVATAAQANLGLSTSDITPGRNRLSFALVATDNHFIYGPTAVYVAPSAHAPAEGPYPAPIDSLITAPQFLSKTVAGDPLAIKGIYAATVGITKPGSWAALALTRTPAGIVAAVTRFVVRGTDQVPSVGQAPPRIHTPTLASVHGDVAAIDTRVPHDDMHAVDFASVIGRRPIVLLFATPQLCQTRVCGPVTDIELQMEHEFAGRAVFIHNEVYAQNDANKGLRPQLLAFRLQTDPWLFTFDRRGRIAARIEGAFGLNAARQAVRAALG